jgi:hypothetical protein
MPRPMNYLTGATGISVDETHAARLSANEALRRKVLGVATRYTSSVAFGISSRFELYDWCLRCRSCSAIVGVGLADDQPKNGWWGKG